MKGKITKIVVNCELNDSYKDEIKVFDSSPRYLGYDFIIHSTIKETVDKIVDNIKDFLKEYNQPLISITREEVNIKIWSLSDIYNEIKKGYK